MKITIITLTKNNCPTLERSLLSLIDQTHKDWEQIIVGVHGAHTISHKSAHTFHSAD